MSTPERKVQSKWDTKNVISSDVEDGTYNLIEKNSCSRKSQSTNITCTCLLSPSTEYTIDDSRCPIENLEQCDERNNGRNKCDDL